MHEKQGGQYLAAKDLMITASYYGRSGFPGSFGNSGRDFDAAVGGGDLARRMSAVY